MRLLHLYSGNLYGGVERLLWTLHTEQEQFPQLQSIFALCFRGRLSDDLAAAGAPLALLPPVRLRLPWSVRQARKSVMGLLSSADIAVCHGVWSHAVFAPAVRQARKPLVFWAHDLQNGRHWLERLAALTPPDRVIANSRFTASRITRLFPQTPCDVVYLPVAHTNPIASLNNREAIREQIGTASDRVVVAIASRMERWKGHTELIRALGLLKENRSWECWIVGGAQRPSEAAYQSELRQLVHHFGVNDRIRFLGERHDVASLLPAADIYCQPNTQPEPFGIAYIEALYAGLPVIAAADGGPLEIVDDHCGILVSPNAHEPLAEALDLLIRDGALRQRLGRCAPERALELCDPRTALGRLADCLRPLTRPGACAV